MKTDIKKSIVGGLLFIGAGLLLLGIVNPWATAMVNPSAAYCEALGYNYITESTPEGERGLCVLPNGEAVSAWDFLKGKVGQEYSYCQQEGYQMKTVQDTETCMKFGTVECAVCVLDDGTEVEVTELMELDFTRTGSYRISNTTIGIIVAVAIVLIAVVVMLFMRRRARIAAKRKGE
jgi:putative hemolysin